MSLITNWLLSVSIKGYHYNASAGASAARRFVYLAGRTRNLKAKAHHGGHDGDLMYLE